MTDKTLDDVWTVGQRPRPGGIFPTADGTGSAGGSGGTGGPHQNQDEPYPEPDPTPNPCADPETARDWNVDAAAAEALRRMLAYAQSHHDESDLAMREFGARIRESVDGTILIGPVYSGDPVMVDGVQRPETPTVDIPFEGCPDGSVIVAMIHSHPSGSRVPSGPDRSWIPSINYARGDSHGRVYVVGYDGAAYRIHAYDETNAEDASLSGNNGPEVNPEGEPCPGTQIV